MSIGGMFRVGGYVWGVAMFIGVMGFYSLPY